MKATFATLVSLLAVGFLTAAEVGGNNTAVLVQKEIVAASNGYQFICVPVNGLSIDGATTKTVKLSTFLPASTLTNNSTVTVVGETDSSKNSSTVNVGSWSNDLELAGGTILWVKKVTLETDGNVAVTAEGDGAADKMNFLGQYRERTAPDRRTINGIQALCNDSSQAISVQEAVELAESESQAGDTIFVIQNGSSEYKQYTCNKNGNWKCMGAGVAQPLTKDDKVIAAGEAFYYAKAGK